MPKCLKLVRVKLQQTVRKLNIIAVYVILCFAKEGLKWKYNKNI